MFNESPVDKLERQRDEKKDDFPFIQLKKQELRLLKLVDREWTAITEQNEKFANRLQKLEFIKIFQLAADESKKGCEIRERGKNYLMYIQGVHDQRRVESIRYLVTTAIAAAAFIKSFFF